MSLLSAAADPAADSATPLAVLVLAWDEAAPATRLLLTALDADPATAHALLLVPHTVASTSTAVASTAAQPTTVAPTSATQTIVTTSQPALGQIIAADNAAELPDSASAPGFVGASAPETALASSATTTTPAAAYTTVRVLRLSDFTLAELAARAGQPLPAVGGRSRATPAAPYLGSAEVVDSDGVFSLTNPTSPEPTETTAPVLKLLTESSVASPVSLATQELAQKSVQNSAQKSAASAGPPAAHPTAGPITPTSAPEPPSLAWTAALAALADPAPEAAAATPAPDPWPLALNFEIIQYARLAVPLALSEGPFSLIYAPSWPTWLAAQELSQRTGQPLVLHLSTLAAGPAPADTAVGWAAELQRQVLRQADLVLVETYALARRLYRELGLATAAVRLVPAAEPATIVRAWRGLVARRNAGPEAAATSSDEAADLMDPLASLPPDFKLPADDHPAAPTE